MHYSPEISRQKCHQANKFWPSICKHLLCINYSHLVQDLIKNLYIKIILSLLMVPLIGSVAVASGSKDTNSTISMAEAKHLVIEWLESLVAEPGKWEDKISCFFDANSSDANSTEITNEVKNYLNSRLPLLNNSRLNFVAQAICDQSIDNGLGANVTNIKEQLSSAGYFSKQADVVRSAVVMKDYIAPEDGASILFVNLLKSMYDHRAFLFDETYVEFGVGFCMGVVSIDKEVRANVYLLTMVFARPSGPQPKWIQCGHIYFDNNNNNKFNPGEGLKNVLIESDKTGYLATSGFDGKYCFKRPLGEWMLYLEGYPFYQDFMTYSHYREEGQKDGILMKDYRLLLPQQTIDALESDKPTSHGQVGL